MRASRSVSHSSVYIYCGREGLQWQLCLRVKCSRHPDNATTRHAHTLSPLYNSPFRQRCAHQTKKAHTNRCSTSSEVMKQRRTLRDGKHINNVCQHHTHAPATLCPCSPLACTWSADTGRRGHEDQRTTCHVATVAGVEDKSNTVSFPSHFISREHGGKGGTARELLQHAVRHASGQPLRLGSETHLGGDDFNIVGGVKTDPAVFTAFAPALFIFVL